MKKDTLFLHYQKLLGREICLRQRDIKSILHAVLFFLMIVIFFPLTIPANSNYLSLLIPGIVWIGLIFSIFLSSENLFTQDYADGIIEEWMVSTIPFTIIILAKLSIHFFIMVTSIVLLSPLLGILLKINLYQIYILDLSVIFGAPSVIAICALAEAFSVGIKQKSLLMGLIILPFNVPILILGSSIIRAVIIQEPVSGMLAIMLAISLISIFLLPFAIAGVIKICVI